MSYKMKGWSGYQKSPAKHPIEETKKFKHIHNKHGWHWVPKDFPEKNYKHVTKSHKDAPKTGSNNPLK